VILSVLACVRWLEIWSFPDPVIIFVNVVSGLLYLPLLLGCLMLLGGSRAIIYGLIGCYSLTPLLLGRHVALLNTPFSDWRLGLSIAGACIVYRHLLISVLSLKARVLGLQVDKKLLSSEAFLDPLTGAFNRRGLNYQRQQISHHCSGVIMLDIDFFKSVNDTHGHLVGDKVLTVFAAALKSRLRASDLICRWGGEEFLIMVELASNIETAEAMLNQLAAELLQVVRDTSWNTICPELDRVTASAGTKILQRGMSFQVCVDQADLALLQAKRSGRNCVIAAVNLS
jgi:diguanylate cyclase (GGDEF)-like protein